MAIAVVPAFKAGDIMACRVVTDKGEQLGLNILHYRLVAFTPPGPTLEEMAQALDGHISPLWRGLMSSSADYRGVLLRRVWPGPTLDATSRIAIGPGGLAGNAIPPQVSPYCTLYAGPPGRRGRGRIYFPFTADTHVAPDGTMNAGGQTAFTLNVGQMITPLTTTGAAAGSATLQLGIYARDLHSIQDVVSFRVNIRFGSQTRRSFTRRPNVIPV